MTTLNQLPISVTYKSSQDFNQFVGRVAKGLGIYSRTNIYRSQAKLQSWARMSTIEVVEATDLYLTVNFTSHLRAAIYALEYATQTGRLHLSAQQMVDSLTGYQYAKLVIKLALIGMSTNDIVYYLNGKQPLELPVAS